MGKYKTIEVKNYELMLDKISKSDKIDLCNFDLLIYGGGGQNRNYYKKLEADPSCQVLWSGWAGPKWTKFLSFIPGQAGLLKIKQQSSFTDLYYELASYSVSDAIYVPKDFTELIKEGVKEKTWKMDFRPLVQQALNSFILTSETDDVICKNEQELYFYDYYFGQELHQELKSIIEGKNKGNSQHHL